MEDVLIYHGDALKALDDSGRVGGYLVRFSDSKSKDLHGEYFDAKGYYGPADGDGAETLFEHGFPVMPESAPAKVKDFIKSLADRTFQPLKTRRDEIGIWAETVLDLADEYEKAVYGLVKMGKLGWSSGAPGHRVKMDKDGRITRWPIAEGSLTPRPAEPKNRAVALKSLAESAAPDHFLRAIPDTDALHKAAAVPVPKESEVKNIFERELAEHKRPVPELWATFYKIVGDVAKAAASARVTGVPVDTHGLVTEAATGFLKSLVPVVTEQIAAYAATNTDEPFFLAGATDARLKALLTDSDVAFRDSLPDHSKAVASAVEEFAELTKALRSSLTDYAGRAERKSAFRVKEGRELAQANLDLMEGSCGRLKAATDDLLAIHDALMRLVERARRPKADEMKSANEARARELRAKFLQMEAARLGIELAATAA